MGGIHMDMRDVGRKLQKIRKRQGLTQEQLAERTDLSATYIGMIERGIRIPSLDTFILILDELGVTADDVLYDTLKNGYQTRMAMYEQKILKLNGKESKRFFAVVDAMLDE